MKQQQQTTTAGAPPAEGPPRAELRQFKTFRGREGVGTDADLYLDGRRVCHVLDDASGGPWRFRAYDPIGQSALDRLERWLAAQPPEPLPPTAEPWERELWPEGRKLDMEAWVARLCDRRQTVQQVKRACRTKTLYRLPSQPAGEYFVMAKGFTPDVAAALRTGAGQDVVILNEVVERGEWADLARPLAGLEA